MNAHGHIIGGIRWREPLQHTPSLRASAMASGCSALFHLSSCSISGNRPARGRNTAVSPMARGRGRGLMCIGRATQRGRPSSCSSMAEAGNAVRAISTVLSALRWRRKVSLRLCRIIRSSRRRGFRCLSKTPRERCALPARGHPNGAAIPRGWC